MRYDIYIYVIRLLKIKLICIEVRLPIPLYHSRVIHHFLGTFENLRKATICFVMSVRLSLCLSAWNNRVPTGLIFMKFDIQVFF